MPIYYQCTRCTSCCRWPGDVRLTDDEIRRMAEYKGLSESEFVETYTRVAHYRHGLTLIEKPNGECIFLEGDDCSVQEVKPKQCRDFPNRWHFPGFQAACQSTPREVNLEEYRQLLGEQTGKFVAQ